MGRKKGSTLTERARTTVPGFDSMYKKLEQKVKLSGLSASTLINYGRSMAKISLHFGKTPLDLEDDTINEYLLEVKAGEQPSESYFKHTVYGLRYLFRLFGREDRAIQLPPLRRKSQLPVVLSRAECKRLFRAPKMLKHRVLLALVYSAGLRLSELIALRLEDVDSGRMQIRIRQGKGNKDRYVVLSSLALQGLRKYYLACHPKAYLFNGQVKGKPMGKRSVQWIMRSAVRQAGIKKQASLHTLRHSFATHLIEDGVDIFTVKEQLGHAHIETTLRYIHIARNIKRTDVHSPLDTLYQS